MRNKLTIILLAAIGLVNSAPVEVHATLMPGRVLNPAEVDDELSPEAQLYSVQEQFKEQLSKQDEEPALIQPGDTVFVKLIDPAGLIAERRETDTYTAVLDRDPLNNARFMLNGLLMSGYSGHYYDSDDDEDAKAYLSLEKDGLQYEFGNLDPEHRAALEENPIQFFENLIRNFAIKHPASEVRCRVSILDDTQIAPDMFIKANNLMNNLPGILAQDPDKSVEELRTILSRPDVEDIDGYFGEQIRIGKIVFQIQEKLGLFLNKETLPNSTENSFGITLLSEDQETSIANFYIMEAGNKAAVVLAIIQLGLDL